MPRFRQQPIDIATIEAIIADGSTPVLLQSAELALRRRHRSGAAKTGARNLRRQSSLRILLRHHLSVLSKGWTHDKFSIVQSVAGACYHMMLSAHLRGFATIWNAGIGDPRAVADAVIPPTSRFKARFASAGRSRHAPAVKAPRRSVKEVWSTTLFKRPAHATYPAKPARYPFFRIHNTAIRSPNGGRTYGAGIASAIFAAIRFGRNLRSRASIVRGDRATRPMAELDLLPSLAPGSRLVDLMPWGGTYTVELRRRFGPQCRAAHRRAFSAQPHLHRRAPASGGLSERQLHNDLIKGGRFPYADGSIDAVFAAQALEHTPEPERVLDEIARVLKPGGHAVITVRNRWSRYGWNYHRRCRASRSRTRARSCRCRRSQSARCGSRASRSIGSREFRCRPRPMDALFSGAARFFCRLYAARVVKLA